MTVRSAAHFDATKPRLAWLKNLPAGLRPTLSARHHAPSGFGQIITPLDMGDAKQAMEMYAGRFEFAGQPITASPSDVFAQTTANPEWREAMAGLSWLSHFNASNRSLHDQYAMRLLHYWNQSKRAGISIETQTETLISLSTHGQMIARRCENSVQASYFDIVAHELKLLLKLSARNSEQSLEKSIALLHCLNGFQGLGNLRELAYELIERNLNRVILGDGGHVSRSTQNLIIFLERVVPLQLTKSSIMPPRLSRAVENGLALLRLLQCADGKLTGLIDENYDARRLQQLFEIGQIEIPKFNFAPQSSFARIDHEKSKLIADTSTKLGLDFSDGKQKIIQSHSLKNQHTSPAMIQTAPQGTVLTMQSANQKRTCFLSADGLDLRIEDEFCVDVGGEILIHVAPGIRLSSLMEGQAVMFVLPDQSVWHLKQRGGTVHIRQTNMQSKILVQCDDNKPGSKINWSLKKQAKAVKYPRKKSGFETELLI
jgi:hypothetical protein